MKKKLLAITLVIMTTLSSIAIITTTAKADSFGGWHKVNGKWHSYIDGNMEKGWVGVIPAYNKECTWWYCDKKTGDIVKGWLSLDGNWYYLDPNKGFPQGAMAKNWNLIDGKWYYFDNDGKMKTGWQFINGEWYLLNNSGAMKSGWKLENNKWYYMNEQGKMAKDWVKINNQWYFLNQSGEMQIGWLPQNDRWYYLNNNGSMATGWNLINERWYFMDGSGVMQNSGVLDGWQINNNGVATVTCEKAKNILKTTLKIKPTYIEYDYMERGITGEYEYYRFYASNKPRDKKNDNIIDFYSVNKYNGQISVG